MRTNADITVYNKYFDTIEKLDKYKRTEIKGVEWNASKGVNVIKSGLLTADAAVIIIFMNRSDFGEKQFKTPKAWRKTPNVDMPNYFTLAPDDIIVKGLVDMDINDTGGPAALEKQYDDVLKIKSVDQNDQGSPMLNHWRVGAG